MEIQKEISRKEKRPILAMGAGRTVAEQLEKQGASLAGLSSQEGMRIRVRFKEKKRRRIKSGRLFYVQGCSDGCCSGHFLVRYSGQDHPFSF